jgi:HTH-type transcriptional regulator/antitoxin HipB
MPQDDIPYGKIQTAEELGRLARALRKQRRLTLETVSGLGYLSSAFCQSSNGARRWPRSARR